MSILEHKNAINALLLLLVAGAVFLISFAGCSTDCLYKSYTTSNGQKGCARVCPLKDDEGNDVTDGNGKAVFESPEAGEDVDAINCDPFRSATSSLTGTSSSTTTTSGTSG